MSANSSKKLDDLGVADNTIVVFTTDNGAEVLSWPDGGATPFRGEKDTNWEGGWRVPCVMRWPGVIKPGTRHQRDPARCRTSSPTFAAAAGEPDLVAKVHEGPQDWRHDLQGPSRRLQPAAVPRPAKRKSPRKGFLYWSDDGDLMARAHRTSTRLSSQNSAPKALDVWREPLIPACASPSCSILRAGPFRARRGKLSSTTRGSSKHVPLPVRFSSSGLPSELQELQGISAATGSRQASLHSGSR